MECQGVDGARAPGVQQGRGGADDAQLLSKGAPQLHHLARQPHMYGIAEKQHGKPQ